MQLKLAVLQVSLALFSFQYSSVQKQILRSPNKDSTNVSIPRIVFLIIMHSQILVGLLRCLGEMGSQLDTHKDQ